MNPLLFAPLVAALPLWPFQLWPRADKGPQVGDVAPAHGFRAWLQKSGETSQLAGLRGRVVLVHTFAWNCSSCLKAGIPLVVDLLAANRDRGLSAISVTTPAKRAETQAVVAKFGMKHAIALENPMKSASPYIDASNPFTYVFVIGRNGDLVWRGDPSTKTEECLEAVQRALDQETGRELDRELHPALAKAVRAWFAGDYAKARKIAAGIAARHGKSRRGDAPRIAADGRWLVDRIDGLAATLTGALDGLKGHSAPAAGGEVDTAALRFLTAKAALKGGFGGAVWKRASSIATPIETDPATAPRLARAAAWLATRAARPALFPVRRDRAGARFAAQLKTFAARFPDSAEAAAAARLLDGYGRD